MDVYDTNDPQVRFYMCAACRCHIASLSNRWINNTEEEEFGALFSRANNVLVGLPEESRTIDVPPKTRRVVDVWCTRCRAVLGREYVDSPFQGWKHLILNKLFFWDGALTLDHNKDIVPVLAPSVIRPKPALPPPLTSPWHRLYRCANPSCGAIIAFHHNLAWIARNFFKDGVKGGIFHKVQNVQVDGLERHKTIGITTVADVHCDGCTNWLGYEFIKMPDQEVPGVIAGMKHLILKKLLFCDGDQAMYAHHEPIA